MQIQFIRNIQFTKLVKADGRLREFNFRKSNGLQEGIFTVDVSDDRGNSYRIPHAERRYGVWKIVKQQMPAWVWENEEGFHTLIEEEMGGDRHSWGQTCTTAETGTAKRTAARASNPGNPPGLFR